MKNISILQEDIKMKRLAKVLMLLALGAVICLPGMAQAWMLGTTDSFNLSYDGTDM